jgi:hypothetical protein
MNPATLILNFIYKLISGRIDDTLLAIEHNINPCNPLYLLNYRKTNTQFPDWSLLKPAYPQ